MSLQLSMVMSDVEAAGMMIMGVLEPVDTLLHVNECNEPARGKLSRKTTLHCTQPIACSS